MTLAHNKSSRAFVGKGRQYIKCIAHTGHGYGAQTSARHIIIHRHRIYACALSVGYNGTQYHAVVHDDR